MIKTGKLILLVALILYTFLILFIEYTQGQEVVRHYVSDVKGEVPFYAVNTTLTTIILVLTAYNFGLVFLKLDLKNKQYGRIPLFVLTQIFVFALLAFDDRFMLHETIRKQFQVSDSLLHVVILIIEIIVFFYCKQARWPKPKGTII